MPSIKRFINNRSDSKATELMKKTVILSMIMLVLAFSACKKETEGCVDEEALCTLVDDGNLEGTTNVMKNYLAKLVGQTDIQQLNKLQEWLECKRCVEEVHMACVSCIQEPTPPRTISVDFIQNGQIVNLQFLLLPDKSVNSY